MSPKKTTRTAVLIILLLGILFQYRYINEFPSHIHAWAQSDRYALAKGFVRNGLNFFRPETYIYNHQFPGKWKVPSGGTVTAVDFPVHDYIPAVIMRFTGNTSPWIFRLYILIYGMAGLFFLFRLALLLTGDTGSAFFVLLFAATSPVFVYYQGGFLPTIPSLANAIIGIYLYTRYLFSEHKRDFGLAVFFLTLAALSRTTFVIPLLAVTGLDFLRRLRQRAGLASWRLSVLLSGTFILGWFFYKGYLRREYGSDFLGHLMPPGNLRQAGEVLSTAIKRWSFQYLSLWHYIVLTVLAAAALYFFIRKKERLTGEGRMVLYLTLIMLAGYLAFALVMLRQFPEHDYYFLDTFFLPVLLLLITGLSLLPAVRTKRSKVVYMLLIVAFSLPMILHAEKTQRSRRVTGSWDKVSATIRNFRGAGESLDSLGIPSRARMLVIAPYAPNIPFILMNRKGYVVMEPTPENIRRALGWDYDYLVLQDEFFIPDVYRKYPEILSRIRKIHDNGRVCLCLPDSTDNRQTLEEFLGLEDRVPVFSEMMDFDMPAGEEWRHTRSTDTICFSGKKSGLLTTNMPFGLTFTTSDLPALREEGRILFITARFFRNTPGDCRLVVSVQEKGQNIYYNSFDLGSLLKKTKAWEKLDLMVLLPVVGNDDYELAVYLWNTGRVTLFTDDFRLRIY